LFGGANPERVQDLFADLHVLLAQYVRALVLLSLATFLAYSVGLSLLGVPFAVLLAFVAALGEFVPVAGTFGAKIVIVVVAALAGYSGFLWLVLFLLAYRLFLDYVLQPKLLGAGVELPPLAVIFAVLAGEQISGIVGAMLAIPVAAALRVVIVRYRKDHPRTAQP
jgi:predicted PurR-regulated permease PerM